MELLAVAGVLGLLLAAFASAPDLLKPNRRIAAVHELAAVLEQARSQALRGGTPVFVAFSPMAAPSKLDPCRQYAIFVEKRGEDGQAKLQQADAWHHLSSGLILDPDAAAPQGVTWTNVYALDTAWQREVTFPDGTASTLPCLGFGALGEVVHPGEGVAGPFAFAVAEGHVENQAATVPHPARTLSLEVRRSSGKVFIHP